jgi:plastocyanin
VINKTVYAVPIFAAIIGLVTLGVNSSNEHNLVFAQGDQVNVSIVHGSATMIEDGYDPDPVQVTAGQTVVWTNDDVAFHTVTSGLPGAPDAGALFDSGLEGPTVLDTQGKTFEHTFDTAGEFDYHCIVHPALVGKVIVS